MTEEYTSSSSRNLTGCHEAEAHQRVTTRGVYVASSGCAHTVPIAQCPSVISIAGRKVHREARSMMVQARESALTLKYLARPKSHSLSMPLREATMISSPLLYPEICGSISSGILSVPVSCGL